MVVKRKTKSKISATAWVLISVLATLAMVPNGTAVKLLSQDLAPASLAAIRYSIVAIILMVIFFMMFKKHKKAIKKNLLKIIITAIPFSVGGPLYISAIAESSASYVSVLLLLSPIIFGIFSMILTKDKITKSSVLGILFAVLGGTIVILLPVLLNSSVGFFGIIPLIAMAFYILLHAAFMVAVRRQNESGVPLFMVLAVQYLFGAITSMIWAALTVGDAVFRDIANMTTVDWLLIAYLSVGFCVILRYVSVKGYEKTGTSTTVTINYLGQVLAVIFPALVIGEVISWEMAVGAILIMVGIFLTRKHHQKYQHHRSHA
ncbi:MAG: DMT family transporter [Candidatus Nomurabacteria bacterium]|jgi:drug/metabolite transporter (DMT)-like permease|nr:DMT family transporter [Candidatus Nomurabacteria bacterium]